MSNSSSFWFAALGLLAASPSTATPAVAPTVVQNGWQAALFAYERPAQFKVEVTTPTAAQVDWTARPSQMRSNDTSLAAATSADPRNVAGMNVVRLRFTDVDGDVVPVLLCTPRDRKGPFPVVVAVHGLTSHKAQVAAQVAPELTKRGFAVLCPDMPRHGERPGDPRTLVDRGDLAQAFELGRRAVNDVRQTIDLAEQRPDLDTSAGVFLVGYSMGSWINSVVGAADVRVRGMVLMVGGALDIPAMALMLPKIAATDPRLALAHFAGRPVLLLNGKCDLTVPTEWANRLFAAAAEPKKQVWYDCGHLLTPEAYQYAAEWIADVARQSDQKATRQ